MKKGMALLLGLALLAALVLPMTACAETEQIFRYAVTDDPDSFDTYAEMFLGEPAGVHANLVEDIASYGKERG